MILNTVFANNEKVCTVSTLKFIVLVAIWIILFCACDIRKFRL